MRVGAFAPLVVFASLANGGQAAEIFAGVATEEASVVIEGEPFTQVRVEGRDFFVKAARPGSVLVEVRCEVRDDKSTSPKLEPQTRPREFVKQLTDGCRSGRARFTFEEKSNRAASEAMRVRATQSSEKPPTAQSLSPDLDPHVLPQSFGPDDQPRVGKEY